MELSPYPTETPEALRHHLWAIVLAGGDGVRLRPLVRLVCGDERPKQYAPLLHSRTLLGQTLDRVGHLVPPERTVVVTLESHARYVETEFRVAPRPLILAQPESRGTAAGVLYPVHWVHARDPHAMVMVFPSDHYVSDEAAFIEHSADVLEFIDRYPDWIVLLGAEATHPETDYGWIEPGDRVGSVMSGSVRRVRQFIEKPSKEIAETLLANGYLWNTFVFGARARALIEAGRQCLPHLHERLARIPTFMGTEHERWAVQRAYALAPAANFSRSVLASAPHLAVSTLPGLGWCDLGSPERAVKAMTNLGISLPSPEGMAVMSA